jgi:hypothetical protein
MELENVWEEIQKVSMEDENAEREMVSCVHK